MRTLTLTMAFVLLAGVFCAGDTSKQTSASNVKWPKEALSPLTEDELVRFVKALPAFSAALKAASWAPMPRKEGDGPVASLTSLVEGMNVPGVDESLKVVGGWAKLRPTLYKVLAASGALSVDAAPPQMIEQMKKDTSAVAKKGLKDYEAFKGACSQIPEANKQVVAEHQQELQVLQSLGRKPQAPK